MTTARLIKMTRLVLACRHWGKSHRASITIDNDGDHTIRIYTNVLSGTSESILFYCDKSRRNDYPSLYIYDPDFQQAEALIIKCLSELDGDEHV